MKKHTWSPLAPPRLTLASPGASGGTPPDENVSKNTQKNGFRSIKIRKQISVKKYSEKHLPLQNPLERGGLGEAHLDNILLRACTMPQYDAQGLTNPIEYISEVKQEMKCITGVGNKPPLIPRP